MFMLRIKLCIHLYKLYLFHIIYYSFVRVIMYLLHVIYSFVGVVTIMVHKVHLHQISIHCLFIIY